MTCDCTLAKGKPSNTGAAALGLRQDWGPAFFERHSVEKRPPYWTKGFGAGPKQVTDVFDRAIVCHSVVERLFRTNLNSVGESTCATCLSAGIKFLWPVLLRSHPFLLFIFILTLEENPGNSSSVASTWSFTVVVILLLSNDQKAVHLKSPSRALDT